MVLLLSNYALCLGFLQIARVISVYDEDAGNDEVIDALKFVKAFEGSRVMFFELPPPQAISNSARADQRTDFSSPLWMWRVKTAAQMLRLRRYYIIMTELTLDEAFQTLQSNRWQCEILSNYTPPDTIITN